MTDKKYEGWTFGDSTEMDKREHIAEDFYNRILRPNEWTFYCADEACFYALYCGDFEEAQKRIYHHYGYLVKEEELLMPFWKLLDRLYAPKTNLLGNERGIKE